ncbi:unnamed protein product [Leptidea sinapis]|uniref:Uncharacterized protein n=1 Tax=Leptidea sinapis TaxID=189913 RepID=A0A5E4QI73_9NEOP|nr:unnamed protein product [Leptidea sinapis]
MMWESIAGTADKDKSLLAILVLIYQSSVTEHRTKEWPLLAFGIIFLSGIVTVLVLLFPAYEKLQRVAGDQWRLFAGAMSALGTALTVAVLSQGISIAAVIDETVIPILVVLTTAFEIVGFVFIYGSFYLRVDIKFITGSKIPCFWLIAWWLSPIFLIGVTGWWLRGLIRTAWSQGECLWPLMGALIGVLVVFVIFAAIAVAKEEQYNIFTKISAAFRPSRLWGPEEPLARYMWMSQRFANDTLSSGQEVHSDSNNFGNLHEYDVKNDVKYHDNWIKDDIYQSPKCDYEYDYGKEETKFKDTGAIYSIPGVRKNAFSNSKGIKLNSIRCPYWK